MESAKDFGFNEGYVLQKGDVAPSDHTVVGSVNDTHSLVFPNPILDEQETAYKTATGQRLPNNPEEFGKQYAIANAVVKATGLTKTPTPQDTPVGVDFKGDRIYANPQLANSNDAGKGAQIIQDSGIALGAMGAFADHKEANGFLMMSQHAIDPIFHNELDDLKNTGDVKGFISRLGKVNATPDSKTDYTKYKLFESWNNLSSAQKAIGIASVGMQGYKFSNGDTFETKRLTPEIPGVPQMNVAEGLELASKGINVAPATAKWSQLAPIQQALFSPKKAADVVNTSNTLGLLGYGTDGRAVPIDEKIMAKQNMTATPHFGVGAATIPKGQGIPTGYTKVSDLPDKTVVIPTANKPSAVINTPDVASQSAYQIYKNWK